MQQGGMAQHVMQQGGMPQQAMQQGAMQQGMQGSLRVRRARVLRHVWRWLAAGLRRAVDAAVPRLHGYLVLTRRVHAHAWLPGPHHSARDAQPSLQLCMMCVIV